MLASPLKIVDQSETFCGQGVLSKDCNGDTCQVICALMYWICDLQERNMLTSSPAQVSAGHRSLSQSCSPSRG